MLVRLSEGLWGVCKILVGVQEYLRILLLVFHAYKLLQPRQTVIIRFHAALDRHRLVRQICMDTLSGILFNRLFSISSFTTVSRSPSNIGTIFFFKNSCRNMTIQMFVYDF